MQWNIMRFTSTYKPRSLPYIHIRFCCDMTVKYSHILDIHLPICIIKHNIFYSQLLTITTKKLDSCFVASTVSTIHKMIYQYYQCVRVKSFDTGDLTDCIIIRTIIDHHDLIISRIKNFSQSITNNLSLIISFDHKHVLIIRNCIGP